MNTIRFTRPYSKLLSDPFRSENITRIRETSTLFKMPSVVSFDVFNTLYTPKLPIWQQYHDVAQKFGVKMSSEDIKSLFPRVFLDLQQKYPNYGKTSGTITSCDQWWKELIVNLFEIPSYEQNTNSSQLCQELLHRFTTNEAYVVFEDVVPLLEKLKSEGVQLAIITNSDERLLTALKNLQLLEYFDQDLIFLSYDVGQSKPAKIMFDSVINKVYTPGAYGAATKADFLESCWHIGDNYDEDFMGSIKAGWNGILIDRNKSSKLFGGEPTKLYDGCFMEGSPDISTSSLRLVANNRAAVSDLREVTKLFE